MVKQIFLSRELNKQQRVLVESRDIASAAPEWENAWKQLAMRIYQASHNDPALAAVLKNNAVEIRSDNDTPAGSTPAPNPASAASPMPSVPPKITP